MPKPESKKAGGDSVVFSNPLDAVDFMDGNGNATPPASPDAARAEVIGTGKEKAVKVKAQNIDKDYANGWQPDNDPDYYETHSMNNNVGFQLVDYIRPAKDQSCGTDYRASLIGLELPRHLFTNNRLVGF